MTPLILLVTFFLLGCTGKVQSDRQTSTLRVGSHKGEIRKLNPFDRAWWVNHLIPLIHIKLVTYAPDYSVAPMLADRWEITENGKILTFHLRENVKWHDGRAVTSEDVKFTLLYQKSHWHHAFLSQHLENVQVVSPYTIRLIFNRSYATYLLQSWLSIKTVILPKHIWETVENPIEYNDRKALIGCGPFVFENYDQVAQRVYFKANEDYFGGKPSVDRLIWQQFKSFDPMLLSLRKGDIDVFLEYYGPLPPLYAPSLENSETKLISVADIGVQAAMIFNYRKHPMKLKKFREAVACSLDYDQILKTIAGCQGERPTRGFVPPAYPFHKQGLPVLEQNIPKAEKLLDKLGFVLSKDGWRRDSSGQTLSLDLLVMGGPRYPHLVQAAQILSQQLRAVGIDAKPSIMEYLLADMKIFGKKDYDIYIGRFQPLDILAGCATLLFADSIGNMGTCNDEKLIVLAEAFYTARDENGMREAAYALQDYYAEELPGIALYFSKALYPYRSDRFQDWVPMSSGLSNYWSWFKIKPVKD